MPLPDFVEQEFRDFLTSGILAHGSARLRYMGCALERKWRGSRGPAGNLGLRVPVSRPRIPPTTEWPALHTHSWSREVRHPSLRALR